MGGNQQRVELFLFLPFTNSLALNLFLCTVELSKHVCISVQSLVIPKLTKLCKPSQPYSMISKTSAQHMPWRLDFSTTQSVSHYEMQGWPSVLPGMAYLDTTPLPHPWTHFFDQAAHQYAHHLSSFVVPSSLWCTCMWAWA